MEDSDDEIFIGQVTEAELRAIERVAILQAEKKQTEVGCLQSSIVGEDGCLRTVAGSLQDIGCTRTLEENGEDCQKDRCEAAKSHLPVCSQDQRHSLCRNHVENVNEEEAELPLRNTQKYQEIVVEEKEIHASDCISALNKSVPHNCMQNSPAILSTGSRIHQHSDCEANILYDEDENWNNPNYFKSLRNQINYISSSKAHTGTTIYSQNSPANVRTYDHVPNKEVSVYLENESDSLLLLSSSSSSADDELNCTLSEVDMLLKYGAQYMRGVGIRPENEENEENHVVGQQDAPQIFSKVNGNKGTLMEREISKNRHAISEDPEKSLPRRMREEETNFHNKICKKGKPILKYLQGGKLRSFASISSPVAAYIRKHPTKLMTTAVRPKQSAATTSVKSLAPQPMVPGTCIQLPQSADSTNMEKPILPLVTYESVPTISCTELMKMPKAEKPANSTPKVLKHAGRAVLSTVADCYGIKNSEVSVLVHHEVKETDTL